MSNIKTIYNEYVLIGCKSNCVYFGGLIMFERTNKHPRHGDYNAVTFEPICNKSNDVGKRRQEIYNKADTDGTRAFHKSKSKTIAGKSRAKNKAWNKIADEYRYSSCPFWLESDFPYIYEDCR